jgi:CRP-like cAMP-binding protein
MVQSSGSALRMTAVRFRAELKLSPALRRNVHRYAYALMIQLAHNATCSRIHPVEARLARWLLMTQDRMRCKDLQLTQEFLASMVGVRRVGITTAACSLRNRKLIDYSRGSITIVDREKLVAVACGCYQIVREPR